MLGENSLKYKNVHILSNALVWTNGEKLKYNIIVSKVIAANIMLYLI